MGVEETGYNYHLDLDCSQLANDMNIETCICVSAYYQSSGSTFQGGPSSNSSPLETTSHHHNYLAPSPTPAYDSGVDSTHASTPTNKSRYAFTALETFYFSAFRREGQEQFIVLLLPLAVPNSTNLLPASAGKAGKHVTRGLVG